MALPAALARAATQLLRGSLPPAGSAAVVSPLLYRCHRQLCGTPTADEPSAAGPWDEAEAEILRDVKPVVDLVTDIIHSRRYRNGGFLSPDDEKVVTEKLLSHHPRAEEKIGCGLDGIMVSVIT
ncbi:protein DCL homolog, chloroplastic-like [Miscanthus floridulus]|uniref:protein DCL homolog, chloroplastic-like n=1 Tax=Miscanthus floridulus TaxID=154761 RepID=UPI0034583E37